MNNIMKTTKETAKMKGGLDNMTDYQSNKNFVELWIKDLLDNSKEYSFSKKEFEYSMYPGRRARPLLFLSLLNNHINQNGYSELIKRAALSIEIAHRASLIVDDQVDKDLVRRNSKTFHAEWGSDEAILFGHQLMSSAFLIINSLGADFSLRFAKAYSNMCLGQRADIGSINYKALSYTELYTRYVLLKTSSIYRLILEYTALIQKFDDSTISLYGDIGESFGRLYQLYNDYYDDSYNDINIRGEKNYYNCNLSLFSAVVADYGSVFEKKKIISVLKSPSINKANYTKIKKLYTHHNIIEKSQKIIHAEEKRLSELLEKADNTSVRDIISALLSNVRENTYWDQKNFAKAGY